MPSEEGVLVLFLHCEISGSDLELIWVDWRHSPYTPKSHNSLPIPYAKYAFTFSLGCRNSLVDHWPLYSVIVSEYHLLYPVFCLLLRNLCESEVPGNNTRTAQHHV